MTTANIKKVATLQHQFRIIAVPLSRPGAVPRPLGQSAAFQPTSTAFSAGNKNATAAATSARGQLHGLPRTFKQDGSKEKGHPLKHYHHSLVGEVDESRILSYYQFQLRANKEAEAGEKHQEKKSGILQRWIPEEGIPVWAMNKSMGVWDGWGKKEVGSWQNWVYRKGQDVNDRLDFEEVTLRGIDPSLGPSMLHPDISGKESTRSKSLSIPLLYPPSVISPSAILNNLRSLVAHRAPKHRRGVITWLVIAPFMAPFMIVPVIPNLPFFFCLWRAWSHYKAYRASQYLQSLIDSGSIQPKEHDLLDRVYQTGSVHEKNEDTSPPNRLLIGKDGLKGVVDLFELSRVDEAEIQLYRAHEQAKMRPLKKISLRELQK